MIAFLKRLFIGRPKDFTERGIFHKLALVPFLAWVGLGADGLSSSAYGPDEAFRTLGEHTYLALGIGLLTAITVFIIAAAYSQIIKSFPQGGGGYVVATKTLGPKFGVVSGSALLIDYVLTIAVSIAAAGDALFSFIPLELHYLKFPLEIASILMLMMLNIRGVKESVIFLTPVFLVFLLTHVLLIGYGIIGHLPDVGKTATSMASGFETGLSTLGVGGMALLFLHAFSMGGGTYTGIEAVSNGMQIMREPKVKTARTTMTYMAVSLAFTASGLLICYLLWQVVPVEGQTMNAALLDLVSRDFAFGRSFTIVALISEGALLIVAAQAGFIDGPRVLSNMAGDSWLPHRFTSLSDRLTMQNGIAIMSLAAVGVLIYTRGDVRALVVMYSINVFLTFSLSMIGMIRHSLTHKLWEPDWRKHLTLFGVGAVFCLTILAVTTIEKFKEGGWITLFVTGTLIGFCFLIRRHYDLIKKQVDLVTEVLTKIPESPVHVVEPDPDLPIAGILVSDYHGVGIHTLLGVMSQFRGQLHGVVFLSVGQVDTGKFKGSGAIPDLQFHLEFNAQKYVDYARNIGIPATYRTAVGIDVVDSLEKLCVETTEEFPRIIYFASQIVFKKERWFHSILHNQTVFALQRRLIWAGQKLMIWPMRVG